MLLFGIPRYNVNISALRREAIMKKGLFFVFIVFLILLTDGRSSRYRAAERCQLGDTPTGRRYAEPG